MNKAGLVDILGAEGSENIQGEEQQKLDVFANTQFIEALNAGERFVVSLLKNWTTSLVWMVRFHATVNMWC